MSMAFSAIALSTLFAIGQPSLAREPSPTVILVQPGGYDGADLDVSVLPNRGWLALTAHGGHWELIPAKVELTPEIRSPDQPEALVLLHARGLQTGKVNTPDVRLPDGIAGPQRDSTGKGSRQLELRFKARRYRLSLSAPGPDLPRSLVLADGHTRTRLATGTDWATLMWAGDLDRDGRLDLIISTDYEDGQSADTCLYLSSAAGKDQLVGEAGCQSFSG